MATSGEPALTLVGRSSALRDELCALAPAATTAAVVERHLEATGTLLGRDWLTVVQHVLADDGTAPVELAWRAAYALHHLGHLASALTVLAYADPARAGDGDWARLCAVRASTSWSRGDLDGCRESVEEALKYARVAGDPGAEASALVARAMLAAGEGDRDLNLHCYERALALAEPAGDLQTTERVLNNLGSRSLEEGRYAEALVTLQRGFEVNERTGHLSGLAILRHNVAEALLGLGRLDEALVECDAARDLWTSLEAPSASVSWQLRGDVQLARGNATQAAMAFAHAARLAAAEDNSQPLAAALAGEAVALAGTDPVRAGELADQALGLATPVGQAVPVVAAGWVRLAAGDEAAALALAGQALELAARHRDLPRLADALELSALARGTTDAAATAHGDGQLREAGDLWRELDHRLRLLTNEIVVAHRRRDRLTSQVARDELRSLGVHDDAWRVAGPLRMVARPLREAAVRVHVLGQFGVEVHGQAVPAAAWPSRKAREVLKVLACRGERGTSCERLGALVWPDTDAVGNRLSVALSHVRSVLEPGRTLDDPVVQSDGGTLRLDLRQVSVDLVDFTEAARAALAAAKAGSPRAVPLLEAAAALHAGELLEDTDALDALTSVMAAEAEEVELLGREVLHTLAGLVAAGPEPAEALAWYARLLAHDPYDEATYGALVGLLVRLGRYGEARRHHRAYALRMAELGVPALGWAEMV